MNFSFHNPRQRLIALLATAGIIVVAVFGYMYVGGFGSSVSDTTAVPATTSAVSQAAVRTVQQNIITLQEELKNTFYASLKKISWDPDTTKPGTADPFIIP